MSTRERPSSSAGERDRHTHTHAAASEEMPPTSSGAPMQRTVSATVPSTSSSSSSSSSSRRKEPPPDEMEAISDLISLISQLPSATPSTNSSAASTPTQRSSQPVNVPRKKASIFGSILPSSSVGMVTPTQSQPSSSTNSPRSRLTPLALNQSLSSSHFHPQHPRMASRSSSTSTPHLSQLSHRETRGEEEIKLDSFLLRYSKVYHFRGEQFKTFFKMLVDNRLLNAEWNSLASREHKLRVLRAIRVLTRDASLHKILMRRSALDELSIQFKKYTEEYFGVMELPYVAESIVEICSILKRTATDESSQHRIFDLGYHPTLVMLLSAHDSNVLQAVLVALVNLSSSPRFFSEIVDLPIIEPLLSIVSDGESTYRCLGAELLDILVENKECRGEIHQLSGNTIFLRLLHHTEDENLLLFILRSISNMALDSESSREIRYLGGIALLLALISVRPGEESHISDTKAIAVCIALTQLSMDDENAYQIRKSNGVYILGQLLMSGCQREGKDAAEMQAHAIRALRFLFSVERNRKVFKPIFPPDFYASFIDIGHYVHDLAPYQALVAQLNQLDASARASIHSALESLRSFSKGKPTIRGYIIQEVLGKGAFGTVYQVQKENGDKQYAMKELPLKEGVLANQEADLTQTISDLCEEVEIISKLEHPNIVRYYTSFVEGNNLYIVMELVEGASLLDHLNSLAEKGQRMPEEKLWPIFIQLCLALEYMHMEKRVVHRDLTPSNIMLDQRRRVKIADFGLARQKSHEFSMMKSVVGTISFSCPEIVKHQAYTEKADIWSLGCILYQMATLKPAFSGTNPLTVAQKIVAGQYDPIQEDQYSPLLVHVIRKLLSTDPNHRPDIIQVSSLISPLLMAELEKVNIGSQRLEAELTHEQELRKRDLDEFHRQRQAWRRSKRSPSVTDELDPSTPSLTSTSSHNNLAYLAQSGSPIPEHGPLHSDTPSSSFRSRSSRSQFGSSDLSQQQSVVHISPTKLRPIHDPVDNILTQLHKIIYISQLPPKAGKDQRRTIINKYKRALFAPGTNATMLKEEMKAILNGSAELIDLQGMQNKNKDPSTPSPRISGEIYPQQRITHEQMQIMIDECLQESGYYQYINGMNGKEITRDSIDSGISTATTSSHASSSWQQQQGYISNGANGHSRDRSSTGSSASTISTGSAPEPIHDLPAPNARAPRQTRIPSTATPVHGDGTPGSRQSSVGSGKSRSMSTSLPVIRAASPKE